MRLVSLEKIFINENINNLSRFFFNKGKKFVIILLMIKDLLSVYVCFLNEDFLHVVYSNVFVYLYMYFIASTDHS